MQRDGDDEARRLRDDPRVKAAIERVLAKDGLVGAICAAPAVVPSPRRRSTMALAR